MRTTTMLAALAFAGAVMLRGQTVRAMSQVRPTQTEQLVDLRISSEIVDRGDRMNVWFNTAVNAHVAVLRFDTDGRVRMLQPERPWHDGLVEAEVQHEVKTPSCEDASCAFVIDDYPGQGYVIAIASRSPLDFGSFANGDYWDYGAIGQNGRITGDPFVALSKLVEKFVRDPDDDDYAVGVRTYYVGGRFEYPRFLCYECHTHVRFPTWDPYLESCSRVQIVRHDGSAEHAAQAYGDMRTVFVKPKKIAPRYLFELRNPDEPFFTIITEPLNDSDGRRASDARPSAQDVGGVGAVPAPLGHSRITPDSLLRRLTPLERALRNDRTLVKRNDSTTLRIQPRLRRRRTVKPDTSGVPR